MSYRDMTFCSYYSDCAKAGTCRRPFTPEVHADAIKWFGGEGAPVSQYAGKPSCHVKVETGKPDCHTEAK